MDRLVAKFLLFAWQGAACATLFTGTTDTVRIGTDIPNASIYIDGRNVGAPPVAIELSRKSFSANDLKAEIRSTDGHCEWLLKREVNPCAYWNMADPFGWWIDYATGALWQFEPRNYFVTKGDAGEAPCGPDVP